MRSFSKIVAFVAFVTIAAAALPASANTAAKTEIASNLELAMENASIGDYDEAKKLLVASQALAKKHKLKKFKTMARVQLGLAIVYVNGTKKDVKKAATHLINALEIDETITLPEEHSTEALVALVTKAREEWAAIKQEASGIGGNRPPRPDDVDCKELMGIAHTLVEEVEAGQDTRFIVHVSGDIKAASISVNYRVSDNKQTTKFSKLEFKKLPEGCGYTAMMPGKVIKGSLLQYYIAAYNETGKIIAAKGSAGSPNIVTIEDLSGTALADGDGNATDGLTGGGVDSENPFAEVRVRRRGAEQARAARRSEIAKTRTSDASTVKASATPKIAHRWFVGLNVGTGGGLVSGSTEQMNNDISGGVSPALLHFLPEVGYQVSEKLSVSLAFRMGLPIGADLPGHATAAPSGLLRGRYALGSERNRGLSLVGTLGAGIIRHTVALDEGSTDTSATGPLFVGAGAGYSLPLDSEQRIAFMAEANVLAGLPVADLGDVMTNFAVHVDINVGLKYGF